MGVPDFTCVFASFPMMVQKAVIFTGFMAAAAGEGEIVETGEGADVNGGENLGGSVDAGVRVLICKEGSVFFMIGMDVAGWQPAKKMMIEQTTNLILFFMIMSLQSEPAEICPGIPDYCL
jgi:hypothetical protein